MILDTIVAPATAPVRSALAIVRIDGPRAAAMLTAIGGDGEVEPRRAVWTQLRHRGDVIDECVATRYAAPHMIKGRWGRIVCIGGISMFKGTPGRTHVSAAKAGMIGMARSLASELAPHNITVNVVAPGAIDTVRSGAAGARPGGSATTANPMGREGRPEEIAHIVTMLCRPDAAYTTGQTIEVNGGAHY